MITGFDHIGIVTEDIEQAAKFYTEVLGLTAAEDVVELPGRAYVQFFSAGPDKTIELIQPLNPNSFSAKFLKERGEGIVHLCVEVDDINAEIKRLEARGVTIEQYPWISPHGYAAFVSSKAEGGTRIELRQKVK